jgi:AcrR family transcriptional regulator
MVRAKELGSGTGDLRERVLEASVKLIEEDGLSALSMREVARRAGVSHQAPYNHFADREAILGAIAEQGFVMLGDQIARATAIDEPAWAKMDACGRAYVEFACTHPAHFRVMFRPELVDLENCPGAKAEGDRAFNVIVEVMHEAVRSGLPAVPSEEALVTMAWALAHGLACLILDGPLAAKLPDAAQEAHIEGVLGAMTSMVKDRMSAAARPDKRAAKNTKPKAKRGTAKRA